MAMSHVAGMATRRLFEMTEPVRWVACEGPDTKEAFSGSGMVLGQRNGQNNVCTQHAVQSALVTISSAATWSLKAVTL